MACIGIMGGTFNPIHLGHIRLAQAAYEQYKLDKVIFMPSGDPPHKKDEIVVKAEHRMNMVKLAIMGNPHFEASAMEIERKGYSYTFETLKELHRQNKEDELYFIIGADSLFHIESWNRPEEILCQCVMLVANRDDMPQEEFKKQIEYLNGKYQADIRPIHTPMMHISSTEIRQALDDNELSDEDGINRRLIDENVIRYITKHHLYDHYCRQKG